MKYSMNLEVLKNVELTLAYPTNMIDPFVSLYNVLSINKGTKTLQIDTI